MNRNLCYIAEPIDFGKADPDLVDFTMGQMLVMGIPTFRPKAAFQVGNATPTGVISQVNEAAMRTATGAVAFMPGGVSTIGVPAEIGYLQARMTPVLVVTTADVELRSWVVAGWASDGNIMVTSFDDEGIETGLDWLRDRMQLMSDLANIDPDPVTFQLHNNHAQLPTKGYDTDAGYDLYTSFGVEVMPHDTAMIPTGVSVDLPVGTWGQITGRSSSFNRGLIVAPGVGVVDESYTGELFVPVYNMGSAVVVVQRGERVGQIILHEAVGQRYRPVEGVVPEKARGANGFGSTGK